MTSSPRERTTMPSARCRTAISLHLSIDKLGPALTITCADDKKKDVGAVGGVREGASLLYLTA